jgi:hypothetical protein
LAAKARAVTIVVPVVVDFVTFFVTSLFEARRECDARHDESVHSSPIDFSDTL